MEQRPITDRIHDLGELPIPPEVRAQHLHRIADAGAGAADGRRFGRLAVAAAVVVGFFAGSTGLAVAGALPDQAQDVAHDVLAVVQVDVPHGTHGPCVSAIAHDKSLTQDAKKAAKADCPKGGPASTDAGPNDDPGDTPGRSGSAPGQVGTAGGNADPCHGKPPWAGRKDLTPDARAAMKTERAATCGTDAAETDEVDGAEDRGHRRRDRGHRPRGRPSPRADQSRRRTPMPSSRRARHSACTSNGMRRYAPRCPCRRRRQRT